MTNEQEILWLAGLLEGEGCFIWHVRKDGRSDARIELHMTDEDVVKHAAKIMGCECRTKKKHKPHHKTPFLASISGEGAASIMKQILPFMGMRRSAKIEEVLDSHNARVTRSEANVRSWAKRKRCPKTASLFVVNE